MVAPAAAPTVPLVGSDPTDPMTNAPTSAAVVVAWLDSERRAVAALHSLERESAQLYGTPPPDEPTILPPASERTLELTGDL
jgi:hypothetical protein